MTNEPRVTPDMIEPEATHPPGPISHSDDLQEPIPPQSINPLKQPEDGEKPESESAA